MVRPALALALPLGLTMLAGACADMATVVRSQAAHDLACAKEKVVIVDGDFGIYRLRGCAQEASYRCSDGVVLGQVECERLDLAEPPAPTQDTPTEAPAP